VIGKDIARFHTIFWPAMLWSAGLEAPRRVWVHGWLLAAGGERMSKSRGNFLDPNDFVSAFGTDGARYVVLREVPFDRDAEVSWDSFVRRYNADLANDFGNLVNRTVSMTNRYLAGERPAPTDGLLELPSAVDGVIGRYGELVEGCQLHAALEALWSLVGMANQRVDADKPWELAKAAKLGDEAAAAALRATLGDLIEICRIVGLAVAPYMPATAPRVLAQLGYAYDYAADGNGGPPILDELRWGAHAADAGRVAAPEPLFPRLDVEEAVEA
jgi:methionyl-tRNA synthetase